MSDAGQTHHPDAAERSAQTAALGGAVRSVSLVTLLSRVFGLIRDLVIVRLFGDSAVGSAFAAAFTIPNLFRRLLGEGALSAAFIPEYTRAVHEAGPAGSDQRPGSAADGLASLVVAWLGLSTAALTVVIELLLLCLLLLSGPTEVQRLSITLIMVTLPFMPLICITAILAGMLQVRGRMGLSMTGPIFLNVFVVSVGGWMLWNGRAGEASTAYLLGLATVLSGVTQAVAFGWALSRAGVTVGGATETGVRWVRLSGEACRSAVPAARRMLKRFVPVVIGTGTLQVNAFLDMLIGMWPIWFGATILGFAYPLDERSNAIVSFTTRLYQFPLGVFGIAVATAAFPMLSRTVADRLRFAATIRRGVRLSLFIGVPASVGLLLVRTDLVALLFGQWGSTPAEAQGRSAGGFSAEGVVRSSAVLLAFSIGVWAYSLNHLFARVFYARGDTRTPMRVSIAVVVLNACMNMLLIWPFREAGLAWSTSLCALIQCVVLARLARRGLAEPILDPATRRSVGRILLAAAIMALGVLAVQSLLQPGLFFRGLIDGVRRQGSTAASAAISWQGHALLLSAAVLTGAGVYLAACRALRLPELGWLLRKPSRD